MHHEGPPDVTESVTTINPTSETDTNQEGMRPEAFFQGVESLAEHQVELEEQLVLSEIKGGRVMVTGYSAHVELGPMDQALFDIQLQLIHQHLQKAAAELPKEFMDKVASYYENLQHIMMFKREFLRRHFQQTGTENPDMETSSPEFNTKAARHMLSELTGTELDPNIEVYYAENPIGLTFIAASTDVYTKLQGALGGPIETAKQFTVNDACMQDYYFEDQNSRLGVALLPSLSPLNENYIIVRETSRKHEMQHLTDHVVLFGAEGLRFSHLFPKGARTRDRRRVDISFRVESLLKSEIAASESIYFTGNSLYSVLTDPNDAYNYEGILDGPKTAAKQPERQDRNFKNTIRAITDKIMKKESNLHEDVPLTEREKYEDLVSDGIDGYALTWHFYNGVYQDFDKVTRTSIALLNQFPVQDWKTVSKMLRRYSKHRDISR